MASYTYIPRSDGNATISWNANTEPDLAGYRVYYGTASGVYNPAIDVGNTTSYTFSGLLPNTTYYFAITAYDTSGNESAFSTEISMIVWSMMVTSGTAPSFKRHQFAYQGSGSAVTSGVALKSVRRVRTATGGIVTGGSGLYTLTADTVFSYTGSGSIITGGAATPSKTRVVSAAGGIVMGGAAVVVQAQARLIYVYTAAGATTTTGASTISKTKAKSATGSAFMGGAATTSYIPVSSVVYAYTASGVAVTSGNAARSKRMVRVASGTAVTGGAGAYRFKRRGRGPGGGNYTGEGGAVTGGTVPHSRRKVPTVGGSFGLAGSAASVFSQFLPNIFFYTASGRTTTSGGADSSTARLYAATGGAVTGGTSQTQLFRQPSSYTYGSTGGMLTGGLATLSVSLGRSASGGIQMSGAANTVLSSESRHTYSYEASGGLTTDGTATVAKTLIREASGEITMGGAASSIVIAGSTGNAVFQYVSLGGIIIIGTPTLQIVYDYLAEPAIFGQDPGSILMGGAAGVEVSPSVFEPNCFPFRIFKRDCEMEIRGWAESGAYHRVTPFGGPSHEEPSGAEI